MSKITSTRIIMSVLLILTFPVLLVAQQNDRIGVVIHIIGDDNGIGYIPESDARAAVDIASDAFDVINIDFFVVTVRYHNSTPFTNILEEDLSDLFVTYNLYTPNQNNEQAINLYFVPFAKGYGLASLPPSRAALINLSFTNSGIVIQNDAALTSTVPHEFGHFFGLFHTYEPRIDIEVPQGHPNYPNGATAGDLIVDTAAEPDPVGYNWDENCNYTGKLFYQGIPYMPGVSANSDNFMTGATKNRACRTKFTVEQKNYMRSEFDSGERSDLKDRIWIQVNNEINNQNAGGTFIGTARKYYGEFITSVNGSTCALSGNEL